MTHSSRSSPERGAGARFTSAAGRAWPSEALPAPSPAAGLPQAVDSVSRAACGFMSAAASQAVVATDGKLPAERV
jgi:hypothetical protein